MKTLLEIESEYRAALEAAGLADFEAMMRAPASGPPASRHAFRETAPVSIFVNGSPRQFFLKRVFRVPPRHAVMPLLHGKVGMSQPRREWEMLGKLADCGIPAMQRVAYGEERMLGIPRRAFLLVERVPMDRTLEDWLAGVEGGSGVPDTGLRGRLVHQFGTLVNTIHLMLFRWPDLSIKHVFAESTRVAEGRTSWRFSLIDVERMTRDQTKFGIEIDDIGGVKDQSALAELESLFRSTWPYRLSRRDILLFWAGYHLTWRRARRQRQVVEPVSPPDCAWLDNAGKRPRLADDHVNPRRVHWSESDGIVAALPARELLAGSRLRCIDDIFTLAEGHSLSKPGLAPFRDRVRLVLRNGEGYEQIAYLKRFRRPPVFEQLRRMREHDRRDSSAKREAHFIKHLSMIGIPTMKTLAWGQDMSGPWEKRSFIITEEIPGESLETLAHRDAIDPCAIPAPHDRHEIIRQLALIVRHMHRYRFFHRDLYLCHVFLTRNADSGIVLRLIDLARMIHKPLAHHRWVTKDLTALDYSSPSPLVTRADRFRFLYHYLRHGSKRTPKDAFRQLILRIARRVDKMTRHDVSRRRRLTERPAR